MTPGIVADRPLAITADRSRLVELASGEAAFLYVAAGGEISQADVDHFGLEVKEGRIVLPGTAKPEEEKAEPAKKHSK